MRRCYMIFDVCAEEYGPVFEAKNDAVAARGFKNLVGKSMTPNDFILYHVADFDEENQMVIGIKPELVDIKIGLEVVENG